VAEMTAMMKWARTPIIFSVIRRQYKRSHPTCSYSQREIRLAKGYGH
jgi:hypothetical protein